MEIKTTPGTSPITLVSKPIPSDKLSALQVGTILDAKILSKIADNTYSLQLKQLSLQIKTDIKLDVGQTIQLKVTSNTQPPALQLVNLNKTDQMILQAMRTLVAKQMPINELISNTLQLTQPTKQSASASNPLPEQVNQLLKQLINRLPTAKSISTPTGVKSAIQNSGMFLEQKLSQPTLTTSLLNNIVNKDVKTTLLNLIHVLKSIAKEAPEQGSQPQQKAAGEEKPATDMRQPLPPQRSTGEAKQAHTQQEGAKQAAPSREVIAKATTPPLPQGKAIADAAPGKPAANTLATKSVLPSPLTPPPLKGAPLKPIPHSMPRLNASLPQAVILRELTQMVEASLARTQLHQLSTLPTPDQPTLTWNFELPVLNGNRMDMIQLRIEQEEERDKQGKQRKQWAVTVSVDFGRLGPLHISINMEDSSHLTAQIWAEERDTVSLINDHLHTLQERLDKQGLKAKQISCLHGTPPPSTKKSPSSHFLDIEI